LGIGSKRPRREKKAERKGRVGAAKRREEPKGEIEESEMKRGSKRWSKGRAAK
jgi:hypothetical protein